MTLVSRFRTSTATPGSMAPLLSLTPPWMADVVICARDGGAIARIRTATPTIMRMRLLTVHLTAASCGKFPGGCQYYCVIAAIMVLDSVHRGARGDRAGVLRRCEGMPDSNGCPGQSKRTRPRRVATRTASVRLVTCSFSNRCARWLFTVRSEMSSATAISLLLCPLAVSYTHL